MQQEEKSDISNNLKIRKKEKVKLKKNKSNYKRKAKTWIRGPYKKKAHIIIKAKIDDKYFPFTSGKGIINTFNDNSPKSDKDQIEKENPNLNLSNTTFLTNRYPIHNPQSPRHNPQSPIPIFLELWVKFINNFKQLINFFN